MFGYDHVATVQRTISDPGADGTFPIFRVPSRIAKAEIIAAWAAIDTAISGAGTIVQLTLLDGGASGTLAAGTLSAALGASGTGDWSANVPRSFTISEGTLDGGDYVLLKYDESGTIAPKNIYVEIHWVSGVAE